MAGEALALKNFMVGIGLQLDPQDVRKTLQDHASVEAKITKVNTAEAAKRKKTEKQATHDRQGDADDEAKKVMARNAMVFKDTSKHLTQLNGLVTGVVEAAGAIGGVFAASGVLRSVARTAAAFSALQMESQRTGASSSNIERTIYALGQMGVKRDTARSSFDAFSTAMKNPGMKNMLAGSIDVTGDDAQIFNRLGKYFNSLSEPVAIARAGALGIDRDSMLSLEKQDEYNQKLGEYGGTLMGLDPDKTSEDARKVSAAYDKLAADLLHTQQRIDAEFFKPLTVAFGGLSNWMEKNPEAIHGIALAFEALSASMLLKVIPPLLRITGLMGTLSAPLWVLRLLGITSAGAVGGLAAGALLGSTSSLNEGEDHLGPDGQRHRPDGSVVKSDPWDGNNAKLSYRSGHGTPATPKADQRRLAQESYQFWRSKGYSHWGALGMVAQEGAESGFNTTATGDGGQAHGLFQHHADRANDIFQGTGVKMGVDSHLRQLEGAYWEQTQGHDAGARAAGRALRNAGSAEDAVSAGVNLFERPGDRQGAYNTRLGMAYLYNKYVGAVPPAIKDQQELYKNIQKSFQTPTSDGSPYGGLDRGIFNTPPLGVSGTTTHNAGDATFNQTVNIQGVQNPSEMAAALKGQADKGAGVLRNMQGVAK